MIYRWPKPQGVPTAMTLPELELLQDYASTAGTVLEIGALYGFSTIGMALVGAHVTSVDPHYDGPADQPDTWKRFNYNVNAHGMAAQIIAKRMSSFEFQQQESPDILYGLVFVDGDHTWPQPWYDCQLAYVRLRSGGHIALHDVHVYWPGVRKAAELLQSEGLAREVGSAGCLRVYQKSASSVSGMSSTPTLAL